MTSLSFSCQQEDIFLRQHLRVFICKIFSMNTVQYLSTAGPKKWFWLTIGLGFPLIFTGNPSYAEVIDFQLDTFKKIESSDDFSFFSEIYIYPLIEADSSEPGDALLILSDFSTTSDYITYDADEEEYEYEIVQFAKYSSQVSVPTVRAEHGHIAFKRSGDYESYVPSDAVGFVRKSQPMTHYTTTPVDGIFKGMSGTMEWSPFSLANTLDVELTYSINGDQYRSFATSYSTSYGYLSISSMIFEMEEDNEDTPNWTFYGFTPDYLGDGVFNSLINQSGYYDEDDLAGILPDDIDTYDIWNRWYVITLVTHEDSDLDQIPDIMDSSDTVTALPWYADLNFGDGFYWSYDYQLWIFSSILTDWDYWTGLEWVYVAEGSTWQDFWLYSHDRGWFYTTRDWFPYVYAPASHEYFYLRIVEDGTSEKYSYTTGLWTEL